MSGSLPTKHSRSPMPGDSDLTEGSKASSALSGVASERIPGVRLVLMGSGGRGA